MKKKAKEKLYKEALESILKYTNQRKHLYDCEIIAEGIEHILATAGEEEDGKDKPIR